MEKVIFYTVGLILMFIGVMYAVMPSKKMASKYGYRTGRATDSEATYEYAQKQARNYFLLVGLGTFVLGNILRWTGLSKFFILELLLLFIPITMVFYSIEKALQTFSDEQDD